MCNWIPKEKTHNGAEEILVEMMAKKIALLIKDIKTLAHQTESRISTKKILSQS